MLAVEEVINFSTEGFVRALVVGCVLTVLAFLFCDLVTVAPDYRTNTANLPPEAVAILNEHSGDRISEEQWRRLDIVMARNGGWPQVSDLSWAAVRDSWYWFVIFPSAGLAILAVVRKRMSMADILGIFAPSVATLVAGFLLRSPLLNS